MRFGAPLFTKSNDPDAWIQELKKRGYSAAYCPVSSDQSDSVVHAYEQAAKQANIVIAEVGAWSNPLSMDNSVRKKAIQFNEEQLDLADRIGAACCVNIVGSRGEQWDGHHPDNLTKDTFALIVDTVREIIDEVRPSRTFYTLEAMQWMYPDSPDTYLELLDAINRKTFAVHLDPVNLINCPRKYYDNAGLIKECFQKLGPYIKSCHAKDIVMDQTPTVHLHETRPGKGNLDYRVLLSEINKLEPNSPMLLEHLTSEEEYQLAAGYIRNVANEIGVDLGMTN
jgi:sugar phosphate isomerase/epimerase